MIKKIHKCSAKKGGALNLKKKGCHCFLQIFSGLFGFFNMISIIKPEAFAKFSMLAHEMPLTCWTTGAVDDLKVESLLLSSRHRLRNTSQLEPDRL